MKTLTSWPLWLSSHLDLSSQSAEQLAKRFKEVGLPADSEALDSFLWMSELACQLAEQVHFPQDQLKPFRQICVLADLGKFLLPAEILEKPDKLTQQEWAVLQFHPYYSYLLLCGIPELEPVLDVSISHHECWDGSGYPKGLKGEEIPLAARIFHVANAWVALLSPRSFRAPFSLDRACEIMKDMASRQLDPWLVEVFLRMVLPHAE